MVQVLSLIRYIITCGADGDVRIWAGIEDDDNVTVCVAEEKAIAIAHKVVQSS